MLNIELSRCTDLWKGKVEYSSINVTLTYLIGLEVPELNEEDMPMI